MSTLSVQLTCSTNSFNPSLPTFLRHYPCPLVLLSLTIASSFETCIYPLLFADLLFVPYSFPCSNSSFHSSLAALSPHCFIRYLSLLFRYLFFLPFAFTMFIPFLTTAMIILFNFGSSYSILTWTNSFI